MEEKQTEGFNGEEEERWRRACVVQNRQDPGHLVHPSAWYTIGIQ